MTRVYYVFLLIALTVLWPTFARAEAILDARFEGATVEGKTVAGWMIMAGAPTVVQESGKSYLRLEATDAQKTVQVRRFVQLDPDWAKMKVAVSVRHKNVKRGEQSWQDARVIVEFVDDKNKRIGTPPSAMNWKGSSKSGWIAEEMEYFVPIGATRLKLDPALLSVASGTLDLESLTVTVTDRRSSASAKPILPESWKPALIPHWREKTATREKICLNGVWQIRPIGLGANDPKQLTAGVIQNPPLPGAMQAGMDWGYGKVPSTFPGTKEDAHDWALPEAWAGYAWASADAMWFRRSIDVPADWQGRRILLDIDTPQSQAAVFVGDKLVGRVTYPQGVVDLTAAVTPGQSAQLTLFVVAKPFSESRVHAMNPNELYLESTELKQKGLCGNVFLRAEPTGPRIADVQFRPSVRSKSLSLHLNTSDAAKSNARVKIAASIDGKLEQEWTSEPITIADDGAIDVKVPWQTAKLWDIDAPNLYNVNVSLVDPSGKTLDEIADRFGFRELWLDGRDIMLNGSPIHWRVTKIGNNFAGRSKSQMAGTFKRMRELGFNCLILDYDVFPGSAPTYTPMFEAADEAGVILVVTIPSLLPWKSEVPIDAATRAAWERLADYCIRSAQNHPSVLAYSTNHNRLGYIGSLNPNKIDGLHEPVSPEAAFAEKRKIAADAEAYLRSKDPTREVYHHSGGNFGPWETTNCYLNWMPMQERRDYLAHWGIKGVKPLFLTEFGMPFVASWGRYRGPGVYKPTADSEPLFLEYAAAITGAKAYEVNPTHEAYVAAYEQAYAKAGRSNWGLLTNPWMRRATEWNFVEIQSKVALETFPAMRTWGISAILPWDYKSVANWTEKTPAKVKLTEPAEEWTKPGIHPDTAPGFGYGVDETWFNTPAADTFAISSLGKAYQRVNADVLAWIAGPGKAFTDQTHLFQPGQRVAKQVIVINDLRRELSAKYVVKVTVGDRVVANVENAVSVAAGRQARVPIEFALPNDAVGKGTIDLTLTLPDGKQQTDQFAFQVLPPTPAAPAMEGVAVWDPKGDSTNALKRIGATPPASSETIAPSAKALIVGREALTTDGVAPDIRPLIERGGRVVVLEQSNAVLTKRLGFRTAVPSLRSVFVRVGDHSILAGLNEDVLRDWSGAATLIPGQLQGLPEFEAKYPATDWLGFRNTRVWKAGNTGQVASVVIEKPQTGDFLPIVDSGFDLQYAPILVARVGNGEIAFCQMDVSGRTAADPAADRLLLNLVEWARSSPAAVGTDAHYVGDVATNQWLSTLGVQSLQGELPKRAAAGGTWIIGPGVDAGLVQASLPAIEQTPGTFVFLFNSAATLKAFGDRVSTSSAKVLADQVTPSPLVAGIGPSELHLRSLTTIDAVTPASGWKSTAGAIAEMKLGQARIVFCQIDPRQFDYTKPAKHYVKLTHNRTRTMLSRLLANAGVPMRSPLVDLWNTPVSSAELDLTSAKWEATVDPQNALKPGTAASAKDGWQSVAVPGDLQERPGWSTIRGTYWYRVTFDVPPSLLKGDLELTIGNVDDEDTTYLNGVEIGHIGKDTHPTDYYKRLRQYRVDPKTLKPTGNVLLIKGTNIEGPGGILEGPVRLSPPMQRWRSSYYHDTPVATDDPYRYYRW